LACRREQRLAEPLLGFIARERGLAEDAFLQKLAQTLGWPFLDFAQAHHSAGGAEQNIHKNRVSVFRAAPDVKDGTLQLLSAIRSMPR